MNEITIFNSDGALREIVKITISDVSSQFRLSFTRKLRFALLGIYKGNSD